MTRQIIYVHLLYSPSCVMPQVMVFLTGQYDQIIWVNPRNGTTTYVVEDLSDFQLAFITDPETKSDDTYQVCDNHVSAAGKREIQS